MSFAPTAAPPPGYCRDGGGASWVELGVKNWPTCSTMAGRSPRCSVFPQGAGQSFALYTHAVEVGGLLHTRDDGRLRLLAAWRRAADGSASQRWLRPERSLCLQPPPRHLLPHQLLYASTGGGFPTAPPTADNPGIARIGRVTPGQCGSTRPTAKRWFWGQRKMLQGGTAVLSTAPPPPMAGKPGSRSPSRKIAIWSNSFFTPLNYRDGHLIERFVAIDGTHTHTPQSSTYRPIRLFAVMSNGAAVAQPPAPANLDFHPTPIHPDQRGLRLPPPPPPLSPFSFFPLFTSITSPTFSISPPSPPFGAVGAVSYRANRRGRRNLPLLVGVL